MSRTLHLMPLLGVAALVPVGLALSQDVPVQSTWQLAVLLLSLAGFGLVLAQFWLSRRLPRAQGLELGRVVRWHEVVGYAAGGFLLVHPLFMVARRLWVVESDPWVNLWLMLSAPALLPALVAWGMLLLVVLLSTKGLRRRLGATRWRRWHGLACAAFTALATWHVVATGRHSDLALSTLWILAAAAAVLPLLIPTRRARAPKSEGVLHEPAR